MIEKKVKGICSICGNPLPPAAKEHFGTHGECQRGYEKRLFHKSEEGEDQDDGEPEMDFDKLVTTRVIHIERSSIVMNEKVRHWCCLPYMRHPKGCPNYGVNPLCPPTAPYRPDILLKYNDFHLVLARFDIQRYLERKKQLHPDYSEPQLRNLLYWQQAVKKRLKDAVARAHIGYKEIFTAGGGLSGKQSMESAGVFVFATLQRNKIPFDRTVKDSVLLVALTCGYKQLDLLSYLNRK